MDKFFNLSKIVFCMTICVFIEVVKMSFFACEVHYLLSEIHCIKKIIKKRNLIF
jgi:hypothetical protein